jgi:hypothetical protein
MYKPFTYLIITFFSLGIFYIWDLFFTKLVTKVKPNINSIEGHPQPSNNKHPVDGVMVSAASSLWLYVIIWG